MGSEITLELNSGPDNPRNSEGSFATLRDGRIVFIYSHCYGEDCVDHATARLCARCSSDGGPTWTAPQSSVFQAPCAPLSIKRLPTTGDLLAVWDDHSGQLAPASAAQPPSWSRTPLTSAISRDDGESREHRKLLEDDPVRGFCYTAIHPTDDAVLLAYCCGGGEKSRVLQDTCIRRVTLDWLYK